MPGALDDIPPDRELLEAPPAGRRARHAVGSRRGPPTAAARVIAGLVLIAVAGVTLAVVAVLGVKATVNEQSPDVVSNWAAFNARQQCLREAITHVVPKGATVSISQQQNTFSSQELGELVIPWARPVVDPDQAEFSLQIVSGTECEGSSLSVHALP
jgi:hypothetical protein